MLSSLDNFWLVIWFCCLTDVILLLFMSVSETFCWVWVFVLYPELHLLEFPVWKRLVLSSVCGIVARCALADIQSCQSLIPDYCVGIRTWWDDRLWVSVRVGTLRGPIPGNWDLFTNKCKLWWLWQNNQFHGEEIKVKRKILMVWC